MFKVIVQDIQTKHKTGCAHCGKNAEPPTYEIVKGVGVGDKEIWYSCADHLGAHMEDIRHS